MATMTDEEKQRAEDLIGNLEVAAGQVLTRDPLLRDVVSGMLQNLGALRSLLGLVKRRG
jgi:hypothetical protein